MGWRTNRKPCGSPAIGRSARDPLDAGQGDASTSRSAVLLMRETPRGSLLRWLLLPGMPAAALVAIVFAVELARASYGRAAPLRLGVELLSLVALLAQLVWLRADLERAPEPPGLLADAFDFLALRRLHAAVVAASLIAFALPCAWFVRSNHWLFATLRSVGTRALASGDVQSALDGGAVMVQHTLVAALPLLAALHLVSRRFSRHRLLPWLLVPVCIVGICLGLIVSVTLAHFAR
jgi:hypothetical protein